MPVKTIYHPTREALSFGRLREKVRSPRLRLKNYLMRALPTPPDTIDYTAKAAVSLHDILGNDIAGNCTIAAALHINEAVLANAGQDVGPEFNATAAKSIYFRLTGGQDSGLESVDVLNQWQNAGLFPNGTHKIAGYVAINPLDEEEIKTAIWLFENLYFGCELPDNWIDPVPQEGFSWNLGGNANPDNGHAFCGLGYDGGVIVNSWGMHGKISFAAIAYYCSAAQGGEVLTVLSLDALDKATGRAPNGFDWSQLTADLASFN